MYDSAGEPLTAGTSPFRWSAGGGYPLWAYFPAPPSGVTSLNVVMPGGAAAARVPLSG